MINDSKLLDTAYSFSNKWLLALQNFKIPTPCLFTALPQSVEYCCFP